MKKLLFGKNILAIALAISGAAFSASSWGEGYTPTASGNMILTVSLTESFTFFITGAFDPNMTLASDDGHAGEQLAQQSPIHADGSLRDGTYSFVDEDGDVATVRVENGEVALLQ